MTLLDSHQETLEELEVAAKLLDASEGHSKPARVVLEELDESAGDLRVVVQRKHGLGLQDACEGITV